MKVFLVDELGLIQSPLGLVWHRLTHVQQESQTPFFAFFLWGFDGLTMAAVQYSFTCSSQAVPRPALRLLIPATHHCGGSFTLSGAFQFECYIKDLSILMGVRVNISSSKICEGSNRTVWVCKGFSITKISSQLQCISLCFSPLVIDCFSYIYTHVNVYAQILFITKDWDHLCGFDSSSGMRSQPT